MELKSDLLEAQLVAYRKLLNNQPIPRVVESYLQNNGEICHSENKYRIIHDLSGNIVKLKMPRSHQRKQKILSANSNTQLQLSQRFYQELTQDSNEDPISTAQKNLRFIGSSIITKDYKGSDVIFDSFGMVKPSAAKASNFPVLKKKPYAMIRRVDMSDSNQQLTLLNEVMKQAKEFIVGFDQKRKNQLALGYEMKKRLEELATQRLEEEEQAKRDRMTALRSNDYNSYLKLIKQHKNEKIMELLAQTDEYLRSIGAMVQQHRGTSEEIHETSQLTEVASEMGLDRAFELEEDKYYRNAHRKEIKLDKQPPSLVNGMLTPYQVAGVSWLGSLYINRLSGILADEMGLGKTVQTLALLAYLKDFHNVFGPYLIVVPLSTIAAWQKEAHKWIPSLKCLVYKGGPEERKDLREMLLKPLKEFNICLTTYEFVNRDKAYLAGLRWKYIVIDEGHRVKNKDTKLFKVLSKDFKADYRLLLTGTPLQNSVKELWSLLNFVLPMVFTEFDTFESWFHDPIMGSDADMDAEEQFLLINKLHQVLRPFLLRRVKSEVLSQLPKKEEVIVECPMSAWQQNLYDEIRKDEGVVYDPTISFHLSRHNLQNTLILLRKIANHPWMIYDDQKLFFQMYPKLWPQLVRASGKFMTLDRILIKLIHGGHKCLIFSQFTTALDWIEYLLKERRYYYLRLDGSTKAETRPLLMQEFNSPNSPYFVFLLSTKAGGLGINLQAADTVVLFDSDWNPQMDLQAQDRAHRIGQTKQVRVIRLCTKNSVDEHILNRASEKLDIDSKIIQAGMFNKQSTYKRRREFLEELISSGGSNTASIQTDKEINRLISRSNEEYAMFTEIDKTLAHLEKNAFLNLNPHLRNIEVNPRLMSIHELPEFVTNPPPKIERTPTPRTRRFKTLPSDTYLMNDKEFYNYLETEDMPTKREPGLQPMDIQYEPTPPPEAINEMGSCEIMTRRLYRVIRDSYSEGRPISQAFYYLPSKEQIPQYFNIIQHPIDLYTIKQRIIRKEYQTLDEMKNDLELMVSNAMEFNHPESILYQDATILKNLVHSFVTGHIDITAADYLSDDEDTSSFSHYLVSGRTEENV
eukprot:TRINITY_DN2801_c0_g1_i1.p1 TRINITY_DN2801_c0_g1~~TRINITY_DN2801_c0_g1_i1.p1  ORF type:complete len:1085 (+),score=290.84 TRINITY_DN2801_c0_g1_i1:50-3304(+)